MKLRIGTAVLALLICCCAATDAQQSISLTFKDGNVWLIARNAPLRAILREWAQLGGSTIVNAEDVKGEPVTLELAGVPERTALDVVLRGVAGYVLARRAAGSSGASAFDRVLILPTSAPAPAEVANGSVGRPRVPATALGRRSNRSEDQGNLPAPLAAILRTGVTGFVSSTDRPTESQPPPSDSNRSEEGNLPDPLAAILRSGVTGFTLPMDPDADSEPPAPDSTLPEPLETAIRSGLTGSRPVTIQPGNGAAADVDVTAPD